MALILLEKNVFFSQCFHCNHNDAIALAHKCKRQNKFRTSKSYTRIPL